MLRAVFIAASASPSFAQLSRKVHRLVGWQGPTGPHLVAQLLLELRQSPFADSSLKGAADLT